jgi:hypothetical protein
MFLIPYSWYCCSTGMHATLSCSKLPRHWWMRMTGAASPWRTCVTATAQVNAGRTWTVRAAANDDAATEAAKREPWRCSRDYPSRESSKYSGRWIAPLEDHMFSHNCLLWIQFWGYINTLRMRTISIILWPNYACSTCQSPQRPQQSHLATE